MKNLSAQGMTLLISSHILAELETYCTAMLVLEGGKILAHQSIDGLHAVGAVAGQAAQAAQVSVLRIRLVSSQNRADFMQWLAQSGLDARLDEPGAVLLTLNDGGEVAQAQCLASIMQAGWQVKEFVPQQKSLQDIYFQAIGHTGLSLIHI